MVRTIAWTSLAMLSLMQGCASVPSDYAEADKALAMEFFAEDFFDQYPSTAKASIRIVNSTGYDFAQATSTFAESMGWQITQTQAPLELRLALEETTGWSRGPQTKNYYLHANILLKDQATDGWLLVKTRTENLNCQSVPMEESFFSACEVVIPRHANEILFLLSDP